MALLERTRRCQNVVLGKMREWGKIGLACDAAGVSYTSHHRWLRQFKGYRRRFDRAVALHLESYEQDADRRAREGWEEPVFYEGKECGTKRRFSDRLMELRLKRLDPVYRDAGQTTNVAVINQAGDTSTDVIEWLAKKEVASAVEQSPVKLLPEGDIPQDVVSVTPLHQDVVPQDVVVSKEEFT